MRRHDEAAVIAMEHVRWCQSHGVTPRDILLGLGLHSPAVPSWDDAWCALARAWLGLGCANNYQREAA